jgi:endonuclease/exonuclease/phosphatase family metal-dependent hydrolase
MPNGPFSVLFWNVWADSQLDEAKKATLHDRFDTIITNFRPNAIGLNEVVTDESGQAPVLTHLEKLGYRTYFAPFSPEKNGHFSGSAFASLEEPLEINYRELGPDKFGAWRGHPGHTIKLIQARLPHYGQNINVVVNYLAHLVPYNWAAHIKHHRTFRRLMRAPALQKATIIGGDFNQFKFMPRLWKARQQYHRATGSLLHPTWKWRGKVPLIQANYDNIFWTKCGILKLEDFQVLGRKPSDHTPLLARFSVHDN